MHFRSDWVRKAQRETKFQSGDSRSKHAAVSYTHLEGRAPKGEQAPARGRKAAGPRAKAGRGDTRRSVEKKSAPARPVRKAGWAKPKKKK